MPSVLIGKLRKFRKMPRREIQARIGEVWRRNTERWSLRLGRKLSGICKLPGNIERELSRRASEMVPGSRPAELAELGLAFPDMYQDLCMRARQRAEQIVNGNWTLLGSPVDLRGDLDWHRDPVSGYRWAMQFYGDLRLSALPGDVDIKYVHELNRHQFVVELSRGWALCRDERYIARARELLLNWIERNPLYHGVNWTCGLEVAVRSISWLWTAALTADWRGWSQSDWASIASSAADHALYLERHLSFYSSPYNHLIGQATALYLLGNWLAGSESASRWLERGRGILLEHGPMQFYDDGFCIEQAMGYHYFTVGFLTHAICTARDSDFPLTDLEPAVARAFQAGVALAQPDGRWPMIGDSDSARAIPMIPDDLWDYRSLNSLGAVLFGIPELKVSASNPGEELYWLLGVNGMRRWSELTGGSRIGRAVLPDAGYVVATSDHPDCDGDWLLFDAGPIADGLHSDDTASVAHGHADVLQLLLFQRGKPLLGDSGIAFYTGDREWVDYFRASGAHNTIEVEGLPFARHAGQLAWSNVCSRPLLDTNLTEKVWLIRGRLALHGEATIERHILGVAERGIWIADVVRTNRPRRVRWFWHVPDKPIKVDHPNDRSSLVCTSSGIISAESSSSGWTTRLELADDHSPVAWIATGYGSMRKGQRIVSEAKVQREIVVATYFGACENRRFAVQVQGTDLSNPAELAHILKNAGTAADILWLVPSSHDRMECYAAGVPNPEVCPAWDPLRGTGNWLSWHRSVPVSSESKAQHASALEK
jgi:hypothetical protein